MHTRFCALALAASLSLASTAFAQAIVAPMLKPENLVPVSAHVHVITDDGVAQVPNAGIVVGDKAALVVDTGLGARNGTIVLNAARKVAGNKPLYLVSTHIHPEHDMGAHAFPADVKMIRARTQVQEIAAPDALTIFEIFRKMSPLHKELLDGATFRKADITFDKEYTLDLGGTSVRLMAVGPTHTPGDTVIWVPGDRVLFSGDVAMQGMPAFISPLSSVRQWLAALDQIDGLKPAIIVPSHGPVGDAKFIATYRAYLTEIRDRTAAEKKLGWRLEQVIERVSGAIGTRYPGNRLAGAISAAYREAP